MLPLQSSFLSTPRQRRLHQLKQNNLLMNNMFNGHSDPSYLTCQRIILESSRSTRSKVILSIRRIGVVVLIYIMSVDSLGNNFASRHLETSFGLDSSTIYQLAHDFYNEKGGKAFHPTFDERARLSALGFQIKYGKFDQSKTSIPGFLDFVGRSRIAAWQALGDVESDLAKREFVDLIHRLCPLFDSYVDAYTRNLQGTNLSPETKPSTLSDEPLVATTTATTTTVDSVAVNAAIPDLGHDASAFLLKNEAEIRCALNSQTHEQFEAYAAQQFPDDVSKRPELIAHLQDRHFHEYVSYIHQTLSQHGEKQQPVTSTTPLQLQQQTLPGIAQKLPASPTSISPAPTIITVPFPKTVSSLPHPTRIIEVATDTDSQRFSMPVERPNLIRTDSKSDYLLLVHANSSEGMETPTPNSLPPSSTSSWINPTPSESVADSTPNGYVIPAAEEIPDVQQSDMVEANPDSDTVVPIEVSGSMQAPSMWTRSELREFKESLADSPDAVIQVGCGEVITVRIPAYPSGTSIVWEFGTDDYDIGFGLFFEWDQSPGSAVKAEEMEKPVILEDEGTKSVQDTTTSSAPPEVDTSPLIDEIIPIYRRNCQQEIYCGSHVYPGPGTYLFKFDNAYSLWRTKTLYYRVYYTC